MSTTPIQEGKGKPAPIATCSTVNRRTNSEFVPVWALDIDSDGLLQASDRARCGGTALLGTTPVPPNPQKAAEKSEGKGFDFNERPVVAIWETTQACDLACVHCRASAQPARDPASG